LTENAGGVAECLFLGNQISKHLSYNAPGYSAVEALPAHLVARFGGALPALVENLGDISKLVDEAQLYAQASKETDHEN
jgi:hypothetical protein